MFTGVKNWQLNIIVFVVISFAIYIGLSFTQVSGAASIFYPSAGMSAALFYIYRKKIAIGLFGSIFLANVVFRIIYVNESGLQSLALSLFFVGVTFIEVSVFSYIMKKTNYRVEKAFSLRESNKFSLSVFIATVLGAAFGTFSLFLHIDEGINIIQTFSYWVIGDAMGIIVFASLVINNHYHDKPIFEQKRMITKGAIHLSIYALFLFFIFGESGNDFMTFGSFQVFIVLMYIISAFLFSFRMIAIKNLMFLLALDFLYFPTITGEGYIFEAIQLSLFVIILSSIASVIRMVILTRQDSYEKMRIARESLEKIMLSTNQFVNVESTFTEESQGFGREYLRSMFEIACELYPRFDRASCTVVNGRFVEFVAVKGYDRKQLNGLRLLADRFKWDFETPEVIENLDFTLLTDSPHKVEEYINTHGAIQKSLQFTVMIGENKLAGMSFDLYENSKFDFTERDIHNYESFQKLMNSYYKIAILNTEKDILRDDIVLSLVRTLELYDLYTSGHSEQVARLCYEFGKELNLPNDELQELFWSGIVHDIGKIGMPADVLNLSRRLTDEEYNMVKQHPQNGYNILSRSKSLEKIADVVLHHHEWYNGRGYPYGIAGEDIPYHSRILHVCDAVDSMAKDRVYRKALTEDQIIRELDEGRGEQFDPETADLMIKIIESGRLYEII